jgi:uncharacterized membrane protein YoaK (UPF0700 family)
MSIHLSLIFSFTFGSFLVGLMVPSSVFRLGISYTRVLFVEGFFLLFAIIWNQIFIYEENSNSSSSSSSSNSLSILYYYYLCSCACGVQNAMITKYSGGIIRTTHPTGGLTDIGSILGRLVTGHSTDSWQLKVLIPLVLCFILGGTIGTAFQASFGRDALVVNVLFIFFVATLYLIYLKTISRTELTYTQLLFGKYTYPFVNKIRKTLSLFRTQGPRDEEH